MNDPSSEKPRLRIVTYTPDYRQAFHDLNIWWIERWFEPEPIDLEVLQDPEGTLLERGGEIWFAEYDGRVVGTCCLKVHADDVYELTKLGVDPAVHRVGAGQALCEHVIGRFLARSGRLLFLDTNAVLEPATKLYEKLGFEITTPPEPRHYARSNVYMEWRGRRSAAS